MIEAAEVTTPGEWQAVLARLPHPHPLQSWVWGDFKSRWGWSARRLVWETPAGMAAAQLLQRRLPRLPYSLLYLPKGPCLDYHNSALRPHILAALEQVARQEGAIFLKIDPDIPLAWGENGEEGDPNGRAWRQVLQERGWRFSAEQIQFRNTVELDLEQPEAGLLAAMKQKTRYNIRLAGRKGITVRPGTVEDLPLMAAMYAETARRDGFAIRPPGYYLDAWQSFQDAGMGHPLIAEYRPAGGPARPVAAVFLVSNGRRAIYMYGASTDQERQRMPNYVLQWEAIRLAQKLGCTVYDMWGAPDLFEESDRLWGVWRFKAGFNGRVVHHIGAWDYPARPLLYWLYGVALPRYLGWLRRRQPASKTPGALA